MKGRMLRAGLGALVLACCGAIWSGGAPSGYARADEKQEACKKAMNDRIQVCTDDCTKSALAAASNYVDTNNNVKFGCLKGCALKQIFQMQACRDGKAPGPDDPTETNR